MPATNGNGHCAIPPLPNTREIIDIQNFIGGHWQLTDEAAMLTRKSPVTNKPICRLPRSTAAELSAAIDAAKHAFPAWSSKFISHRAEYLNRLCQLIAQHRQLLADFETLDTGTVYRFNYDENVGMSIECLRVFARFAKDQLDRPTGRVVSTDFGLVPDQYKVRESINLTYRKPLGVVVIYTPVTIPLYHLIWKLGAALAAGNTCVCKPHPMASISPMLLSILIKHAGIPDGVVNFVYGTDEEVSDGLGCNPDVNAISLMGSTSTSPQIIVDAARTFRRVEVDFAGNNPVIVFPDADISACAQSCVHSCFTNKGEICTCTRRIFVHRRVYSEFMAEFRSAVESRIRIGDPFNPDTFYGPFAYPTIVDIVADKIRLARKEGATVEFWPHHQQVEEGKVVVDESTARATVRGCEDSLFLVPTIITGLKPSSAVATDLYFAPVVSIFAFGSEDDKIDEKTEVRLIGMVNSVRRVICAAVWTKDFERFKRVANKLSAGYVWNNGWYLRDLSMHPGGQATRGYARNGVEDAIEFYSQAKTLVI